MTDAEKIKQFNEMTVAELRQEVLAKITGAKSGDTGIAYRCLDELTNRLERKTNKEGDVVYDIHAAESLLEKLTEEIADFWKKAEVPMVTCAGCGTTGDMERNNDGPDSHWWECGFCGAQYDVEFDATNNKDGE